MKSNTILIASLLILIGMGAITVSCKKVSHKKAEIIECDEPSRDGGGDDEDPVIRGRVKKKNTFVPIDSAYVETLSSPSHTKVGDCYTDANGDFSQRVSAGIYYFKILPPGATTPYVTDTIHVYKDRNIVILVD